MSPISNPRLVPTFSPPRQQMPARRQGGDPKPRRYHEQVGLQRHETDALYTRWSVAYAYAFRGRDLLGFLKVISDLEPRRRHETSASKCMKHMPCTLAGVWHVFMPFEVEVFMDS